MSKVTAPFASMLVVILATFFMLTSFASAASNPEPVDCNPELFSDLNEDELATCNMLYQKFEEALLVPFNIYKLRRVMFPNVRAEPLVVDLSYNLTVQNLMDDPCFGADSESLIGLDTENFATNITWTSSVTLSIIDPKDLDFLQPAILTFTNPVVRHSYTENRNRNQVSLVLAVDTLTCTPSKQQVEDVLKDLTTKAKGYAANTDEDTKIDSWDTAYKGYIVSGELRLEFLFVIGPAISIVVIFLTCAFPVAYKKGYQHFTGMQDSKKFESPYYLLFLSVSGIVVFIDVMYYVSELVCVPAILVYQKRLRLKDRYDETTITRFCLQIGSLLLCIFVAYNVHVWKQILRLSDKPSGSQKSSSQPGPPSTPSSTSQPITTQSPQPTLQNSSQTNSQTSSTPQSNSQKSTSESPLTPKSTPQTVAQPASNPKQKDYSVCCFCNCSKLKIMAERVDEKKAFDNADAKQHFTAVSEILSCAFGFFKCGHFNKCSCDNSIEKGIILAYTAFLCIIAWSVVPIITLVFVNPVLTLAIVSFVVVFFILSAFLISLLFFVRGHKLSRSTRFYSPSSNSEVVGSCCGHNFWRKCVTYTICWDFFYVLVPAIILFLFGTAVVLAIYVLIVNRGASDGGSVGFFVAFIPTLITGGGAWFGKKALFRKTGGVNDEEMPNESDCAEGSVSNTTLRNQEMTNESAESRMPNPLTPEIESDGGSQNAQKGNRESEGPITQESEV